ncbi:MAG: glycine oxidase ThiO [Thermosynechococcus sp.]|uniref:glycine oxidase ThiO n=1 Tax=Thermosynechococcus sp. TaxID=2814275 RepID=UPI00220F4357|nr:glycine oxidase ThiO [Thermosynechococcus sp.]BCX11720.1 MAG: glycine oxidase ThiO [Thermosynechococcus sp.]
MILGDEQRDILIIGGGTMGLAIAIELAWRGARPTVLSRRFREAALHAAAGMLAPQAEGLPAGAMWNLCTASRNLYPTWIDKLEQLTGLDAGYWPCGILAPVTDERQRDRSHPMEPDSRWLDASELTNYQPGFAESVLGAWWFPQDGQVNTRNLAKVLVSAARILGIEVIEGITVQRFQQTPQGEITALESDRGRWSAGIYILATGAWAQSLLPLPVTPRKGQMLALKPPGQPLLNHVIFGDQLYLVPRRSGKVVVGATSEDVGFQEGTTVAGLQALLNRATAVIPELASYEVIDTWWGYRPATPDDLPILGQGPAANLYLATGHYRNGILLAPITAKLMANLILHQTGDRHLKAFSWQRFQARSETSA